MTTTERDRKLLLLLPALLVLAGYAWFIGQDKFRDVGKAERDLESARAHGAYSDES